MYEIDKVRFGAFIAELRKEKGITQKELASQLYISDKAISKWETGHSVPDTTLLVPLAEILDVTVTELLKCSRMEEKASLDVTQTESLIKKVIDLSEEECLGRPRLKKKSIIPYAVCAVIALCEIMVFLQLQEQWDVFCFQSMLYAGLAMVFGVYFNNKNWPHITKALRMWSIVSMTIFPVVDFLLCMIFSKDYFLLYMMVTLTLYLGGLFVPVYVLGRKHMGEEFKASEKKVGAGKRILAIVGMAVALMVAITLFGDVSYRSATRVGFVENANRESWAAEYLYLDGYMQRTMRLGEAQEELNVVVETEDGTIAIEIKDKEGTVIYCQENIKTGTYRVKADGKCTVRITGKEHKGSFYIGK